MIVATEKTMTYHQKTQSQRDNLVLLLLRNCGLCEAADALTAKGYTLVEAQVEMLPQNGYIKLGEDDAKKFQKMLDMFEDFDDVQNVWHNWEDAE